MKSGWELPTPPSGGVKETQTAESTAVLGDESVEVGLSLTHELFVGSLALGQIFVFSGAGLGDGLGFSGQSLGFSLSGLQSGLGFSDDSLLFGGGQNNRLLTGHLISP